MRLDLQHLERVLKSHYPGIQINGTAKESGQRCALYCKFDDFDIVLPEGTEKRLWSNWGDVVLKVTPATSIQTRARMQREIEILQSLRSPYYPTFHYTEVLSHDLEVDEPLQEKLLITIEEYVDSRPLEDCKTEFSEERTAAQLLLHLVEALALLWNDQRQYVHRDLKPDNILIRSSGEPVVIDLGIIRQSGERGITHTNLAIGPCTPMYASPEQLKNDKQNISYKSDLFSLGVIIYELVAGEHPFSENTGSLEELVYKIVTDTPPSLHQLGRASIRFSNVVQKLIEKDPFRRFRKVQTLQQELRSIIEELS